MNKEISDDQLTLRVNVTQRDIDAGHPCESASCPVALALSRHLKKINADFVAVSTCHIAFCDNNWNDIMTAPIPWKTREFIGRYDNHMERHTCKPFSFKVTLEKVKSKGYLEEGYLA